MSLKDGYDRCVDGTIAVVTQILIRLVYGQMVLRTAPLRSEALMFILINTVYIMVVGLSSLTIVISLFIACQQVSAVPSSYVRLLLDPSDFINDSPDGYHRSPLYLEDRDMPIFSQPLRPVSFERSERTPNSADEKMYQIRHVGDLPMFRFG
ncbi:hypothetical protein Tcan_17085 [Toxocara canis]|uniref:Uncharacterized protein n=1 Tax=Toxocara canis TaxID=6265 RepID=A0A0B2VNV3_TOXCA|nr:hypothetical protein Tcan_17085 [Toxocara canis]